MLDFDYLPMCVNAGEASLHPFAAVILSVLTEHSTNEHQKNATENEKQPKKKIDTYIK